MNQHEEQPGHEWGDGPIGESQSDPAERDRRAEQRDVAEHEAAVPSSTEDGPREGGPDVAAHEAAVPSSVEDTPETPDQSTAAAAGVDTLDEVGRSATTIQPTGDDRVDEALSRLEELDRLDVTEHAAVVEDVHRALQDTLAEEEG